MTFIETIGTFVESNLNIAAPVAALFLAWLTYGLATRGLLGADDDYWPVVRRYFAEVVETVAQPVPGIYVKTHSSPDEYVGMTTYELVERNDQIARDDFERTLDQIYDRNIAASVKVNMEGWRSDGSWGRRYGTLKDSARLVRMVHQRTGRWATPVTWAFDALGRVGGVAGDIFAIRQVHVDIYVRHHEAGNLLRIHQYAHDEFNSLNPLTALLHYRGVGMSAERGVAKYRSDTVRMGIPVEQSDGGFVADPER